MQDFFEKIYSKGFKFVNVNFTVVLQKKTKIHECKYKNRFTY